MADRGLEQRTGKERVLEQKTLCTNRTELCWKLLVLSVGHEAREETQTMSKSYAIGASESIVFFRISRAARQDAFRTANS